MKRLSKLVQANSAQTIVCTEADARNHDDEGIDAKIPEDTLVGYCAILRSSLWNCQVQT